jgi:hydrogenase maturation factor
VIGFDPPALPPDHHPGDSCVTCSDTAVPVTIIELLGDALALVATGSGTTEEVSIALVDADVGDTVLVHVGEAIAKVADPS